MKKLAILWVVFEIATCIEPLRLVERTHLPRRRSSGIRKLNYRDSPPAMENVIHSPLENKRVYTKDNFYINAIHPKEREALLYESMLSDGKGSINDIDSFFVTAPPLRTTLAPKRFGDNNLPEFEVSQGSVKEDEEEVAEQAKTRPDLRLVTLPPTAPATIPPFKHNLPTRQAFHPPAQLAQSIVRFPAQPWQIPPINPPTTPNPLAQLFQPITVPPFGAPPNPFFNNQQQQQPWTPQNNSFDPYIPIAVGNPPFLLQQPARPVMENHRQPMQPAGFSRNIGQVSQPIPLPSPSHIETAFNQAKEREFDNFPANKLGKKPSPPIDFSIDSGSSQLLRNFAKVHPHVMSNLQKPLVYRGKEMVIPKMFNFSTTPIQPSHQSHQSSIPSPPISSSSSYVPLINPNQKLDLCCRKQRVSPICQGLCNFDTFNDKTLVTAFLTNQCPGPQLGQAYECASSKADHSQCCEQAGLASFQSGKCMPFCRTHLATPSNVLDYFVCLQVFDSIKGCYRDYQLRNPNIFGD